MRKKITIQNILCKKGKEKIVMLCAYDALFSRLLDESEVDIILVGDSLANVLLGYEDTLRIDEKDILHHLKAVTRVNPSSLVVADMPFMSYQASIPEALNNASLFIKEGLADAVKMEVSADFIPVVREVVKTGIPVMGHIGLLPQQALQQGYRVQGKDIDSARYLWDTAKALEDAGCFCVVLECVTTEVAAVITRHLRIPTIGIGSGRFCDGQVLVTHDLLGLQMEDKKMTFVRRYRDWRKDFLEAVKEFKEDINKGQFPREKESFSTSQNVARQLESYVSGGDNS